MDNRVWNQLESYTIVSGASNWDDAKGTVRSAVFGEMVKLSRDRIKAYHSDLYHDAKWIDEYLVGVMQFDWICRESGTWCGDIVAGIKDDSYTDSRRYRFEVLENDRKWTLNVYEAGPTINVFTHFCEECGLVAIHYVDDMSMWLCSSDCTAKAQNRLNEVYGPADGISEDLDYGNDEPDKQTLADAEDALKSLGENYRDAMFAPMPEVEGQVADDIIKMLFEPNIPTLRNTSITKEINTMDSILRDLREKASEAEEAKSELQEKKYEIDDAVSELDNYIDEINGLIDSLDNLPEVSVTVEIEVNFES